MFSNGFTGNLLDIASNHSRILVEPREIIELLFFSQIQFRNCFAILLYYVNIILLYHYIIILFCERRCAKGP